MSMRSLRRRLFWKLPHPAKRLGLRLFREPPPWDPKASHVPRPPPAGTRPASPDFVGVGAQKAGTGWWYTLINRHPSVYEVPGLHKERHYFDRFCSVAAPEGIGEDYARWFPRPDGLTCGEWTPCYMWFPWVPPLLARAAPHAKLLVVLRDPVERLASGLLLTAAVRGRQPLPRDFMPAIDRGRYDEQLGRLLRHYPRTSILVLQYERCVREPEAEIAKTYEFLGLDPGFRPPNIREFVNKTQRERLPLPDSLVDSAREIYADSVRALGEQWPEIDLDLWPTAAVRR